MRAFWQRIFRKRLNKNRINAIEWFDSCQDKPRAIIQVTSAVQPNGVFVNYGGVLMCWVIKEELEKRGWSVMLLPREPADEDRLKAQAAKLFVDCAGFIYSSGHHRQMSSVEAAKIAFENAGYCQDGGAIAICAPQTFGPFSSNSADELTLQVQKMLDRLDLVYVNRKYVSGR